VSLDNAGAAGLIPGVNCRIGAAAPNYADVGGTMSQLFVLIVLAACALQYALVFIRPRSDIPRLKRDYEANGARILELEPAGFEVGVLWCGHHCRKYRILVDHPFKGRSMHVVGVSAARFSEDLKVYSA
jgi:hypothetical protein